MEKVCSKCGATKPEGDFCSDRRVCKACEKARHAKYRGKNPEKAKHQTEKWQAENPEKVKAAAAKWRAKNREKEKARHAKYRGKNPEKAKAQTERQASELTPSYVARTLQIPVAELPPELLELKREQLQLYRLTNKLRKEI